MNQLSRKFSCRFRSHKMRLFRHTKAKTCQPEADEALRHTRKKPLAPRVDRCTMVSLLGKNLPDANLTSRDDAAQNNGLN